MKAIRDEYDPHGGRAIGSREMLDIDKAEYGGEMLYINKSKKHPMWAMVEFILSKNRSLLTKMLQ